MSRPHLARAARRRSATERRPPFALGLLGGAFALLTLATVPVACGGSGVRDQMGSGGAGAGGTGSGGRSLGTGGGAGTGPGGAAGTTGSGGAGASGGSGATGATGSGGAAGTAASGGAGASGGAAGAAGRSPGSGGGAGTGMGGFAGAGGRGAGGAGGNSTCASAVANAPCSTETVSCGGGCTDICQFCQLLVCTGGTWKAQESAPAPCFSCGPDVKCQIHKSYCQITSGGPIGAPTTHACLDLPATCVSAPTCSCLAAGNVMSANVMRSCSQGSDGSLTTRIDNP